jgi:DNA-binding NtrC family response regulator
MNDTVDIITFILDEDATVEKLVTEFLHDRAKFHITRFDNPENFRNAIEGNSNVRLVLLDMELSEYHDYKLFDMIKYLHRERTGTYIIIVAGFDRKSPESFDMAKEFVRIGIFDMVDKQDADWGDDLQSALERVTAKILFKLNLAELQ